MNSVTWQPNPMAPAWRAPAVTVLALLVLLLVSFRDTALGMVAIWSRSETFTHAFVVPPIALWLIWRRRSALARLRPQPVPWMVLPMALLAVAWWLGDLVSVNAVTHLTLVAMLVAAVPTVLGWRVTREILFPLGFLFFAVPIGEFMTPTLMRFTADFTVLALQLTGVPVFREGMQFVIPSGRWSVIDECSGIRYLMATVMVGSLFAYLNYNSYRRRVLFMLVSFAVPILANWVRAYMIVMLAHLSDNRIATGVDHIVYGWVFFGVVILALFFIGARWAEPEADRAGTEATAVAAQPGSGWHGQMRTILVALAAILVTQAPAMLHREAAFSSAAPALALPAALADGWHSEARSPVEWQPIYVGASAQLSRSFVGPDGRVGVHLAAYRNQTDERKLVSSVNVLVPMRDSVWNQLATGRKVAQLPDATVPWQTATLQAADTGAGLQRQRLTVWRLYWIGGHLTASDIHAKLLQAWLQVRGQPDDAAAIILYTDAVPEAQADRVLNRFASANLGTIQAALSAALGAR